MQKIEIVCMVRVNGEKVPQESIPREEFNKMLEKKLMKLCRIYVSKG